MADLKIALAGNPNAGKTTIFNYLTGLHQHIRYLAWQNGGEKGGRDRA